MVLDVQVKNDGRIRTDDRSLEYQSFLKYIGLNVLNVLVHGECELAGEKNSPTIYDDYIPEYMDGKCNVASQMCVSFINQYSKKYLGEYPKVIPRIIHGELTHSPRIHSYDWPSQHSLVAVQIADEIYWLDITAYQFSKFISVGPIYISPNKPWWFYPDIVNPSFSKLGLWLNNHFGIKVKITKHKVRLGIVEFFQYMVWGSISNAIRRIFYRRK